MRLIYLLPVLMLFTACSSVVEYKRVEIPIRCDISLPKAPQIVNSIIDDYPNILKYTEELERDLIFCVKGEVDENL